MEDIEALTDKEKDPQELEKKIKELIAFIGSDPNSFEADLIGQIIASSLKMSKENADTGQIKLMTRAFKEMRYAYSIFNLYPNRRRISIFGSARTPEVHPDYIAAKTFSSEMTKKGWVIMTGGADGIMKAGLEGAQKDSSFGLSIRLPFETPSHSLLAGDPKLITFRYFFTRKLMFLSHSDAIAAFPGGVGTQDELFEVLTLMQTGKASLIPVVLLEGDNRNYWDGWMNYMKNNLLANGWISEEDFYFFYKVPSIEAAVDHIEKFGLSSTTEAFKKIIEAEETRLFKLRDVKLTSDHNLTMEDLTIEEKYFKELSQKWKPQVINMIATLFSNNSISLTNAKDTIRHIVRSTPEEFLKFKAGLNESLIQRFSPPKQSSDSTPPINNNGHVDSGDGI